MRALFGMAIIVLLLKMLAVQVQRPVNMTTFKLDLPQHCRTVACKDI